MGHTSIYNKASRRTPLYFMDYKKHEDERHIEVLLLNRLTDEV